LTLRGQKASGRIAAWSWIRQQRSIPWPPRSQDLINMEFFIRGYVKDYKYTIPMPKSMKIYKAARQVDVPVLQSIGWNFSIAWTGGIKLKVHMLNTCNINLKCISTCSKSVYRCSCSCSGLVNNNSLLSHSFWTTPI